MTNSQPLVSDIEIMQVVESVCVDDAMVPVWEAHRIAVALRDHYEAERTQLQARIVILDGTIEMLQVACEDAHAQAVAALAVTGVPSDIRQIILDMCDDWSQSDYGEDRSNELRVLAWLTEQQGGEANE